MNVTSETNIATLGPIKEQDMVGALDKYKNKTKASLFAIKFILFPAKALI